LSLSCHLSAEHHRQFRHSNRTAGSVEELCQVESGQHSISATDIDNRNMQLQQEIPRNLLTLVIDQEKK